jgi:hypothetical protein
MAPMILVVSVFVLGTAIVAGSGGCRRASAS